MKCKKFVSDSNFIKVSLDLNLTLSEYFLLLFFDNSFDMVFDINLIKENFNMSEEDILKSFSSLVDKKLIKVKTIKNEFNKTVEVINLDNFYKKVQEINKECKNETNIYESFEEVFGRTLSPMDYEIINAWLDKSFSEELIMLALKEADYNKVHSLRYIDKILFDWHKKGFKTKKDLSTIDNTVMYDDELLNYNWLDNE